MAYGLLTTGFSPAPTAVIREEMNAAIHNAFGASLDLSDTSFLGFLVGISAERFGELWELAETVYSSQDPDKATGDALEALCLLTGTFRAAATPTATTLSLTGAPTTVIPAGNQAQSVTTPVITFATLADATLVDQTAWLANTTYAVGIVRKNNGNIYIVTVAGTSAGAGGPLTTSYGANVIDNTVTWRWVGDGDGYVTVAAEATVNGPNVVSATQIRTIATPVGGWSGVQNMLDAVPGTDLQTDESLRLQRGLDVVAPGTAPLDAIRQGLLLVVDVTSVTVFKNDTDTTDADGVPPHSIESLVRGGADQAIHDAQFAQAAAGIGTFGTESGTVTDSAGNTHTSNFSRPTELDIWVTITLNYNAGTYPTDGNEQVKTAIASFGNGLDVGFNAVSSALGSQAFSVTGVLDVLQTYIGLSDPPIAETTVPVGVRELGVYDTSRIVVVSSPITP